MSSHRMAALVGLAALSAACHVTRRVEDTRMGDRRVVRRDAPPRELAPTLVVTDDGRLRFVVPRRCLADVMVDLESHEVIRVKPNVATFILGLIATSMGTVLTATAIAADDDDGSSLLFVGPAAIIVGLPLAIGPMVGNSTEYRPRASRTVKRGAVDESCGERGLGPGRATLQWNQLRLAGTIDGAGYFAIEPFTVVDAFDVGRVPGLAISAAVVPDGGTPLTIAASLDASVLATSRAAFLTRAGVDATVEPLRNVSRLDGSLRAARAELDGAPALRLTLSVTNDGPGDAFAVRGLVDADDPELDDRVLYVGRIARKATRTVEVVLPLSAASQAALGGPLTLDVGLRDAHGTAPPTPLQVRGKL